MAASDSLRLTSLTLAPGAQWNVTCQVAAFPGTWLEVLKRAYHGRPGIGKDWSLPTRNLIELLIGLDPESSTSAANSATSSSPHSPAQTPR